MSSSLAVRVWGARGLLPRLVEGQERHGGNTTCLEVLHSGGKAVVLDAGTGVANLGDELLRRQAKKTAIQLFLTHFHWDHIMGLPFFGPVYRPGYKVNLYCPEVNPGDGQSMLETLFSPFYSPIYSPANLLASLHISSPVGPVEVEGLTVTPLSIPESHPGGAWVIKVRQGEQSFVFAPDVELTDDAVRTPFIEFCSGADLLVGDATYDEATLARAKGWGHSSLELVHRVGHQAGVKKVVGIHFGPTRSDDELTRLVETEQDRYPGTALDTACEGQVYEVP